MNKDYLREDDYDEDTDLLEPAFRACVVRVILGLYLLAAIAIATYVVNL